MTQRNGPCWCGSGKKWKKCHYPEAKLLSNEEKMKQRYAKDFDIILKSPEQIEGIRQSCQLAASILAQTCALAKPGVTTQELNDFAHKLHIEANATPAPLGYGTPPFPKSICTSLNEVICHGIPNDTPLVEGDIINIDVTCILNGYYGDCSRMVVVGGKTSEERQRVVDVSYHSLMESIKVVKPGSKISDIGKAIQAYAEPRGCSVVHQFVGHGIGIDFHEAPQIPHYANDYDLPIVAGMTFTIEPMINAGVAEGAIDMKDKWTARTLDNKPSAQWEHTLLVTSEGCEILTLWPE
jgi:methionyl aminopeptidase